MAATLVAMKLRMLWAGILRERWKILLFAFVGIYFGFMYIGLHVLVGAAMSGGNTAFLGAVTTVAATALLLLWIVAPVVGYGFDDTLNPRRFAPFVAASDSLAHALVLATMMGMGGLATALLLLLPVNGWMAAGHWLTALTALLIIPLAVYMYSLVGRLCSTWLGRMLVSSQKRRDLTSFVSVLLFVAIMAPMGIYLAMLGRFLTTDAVFSAARLLVWTPLVTPIAVPWLIDSGQWVAVGVQVVYAGMLIIALLKLWKRVLHVAMVGRSTTISSEGRRAIDERRHIIDESLMQVVDSSAPYNMATDLRTIDLWRKLRCSPATSAVAARTTREWIKDPRLSSSLASLLLFPVLLIFLPRLAPVNSMGSSASAVLPLVLLIPLLLGLTVGMHVSYDSTAFWMHVSSGISGRADRWGRFLGALPLSIPLLLLIGGFVSYFFGTLSPMTWIILLFAVFFIAAGLTSTFTGYFSIGVPPPGTNPLSSKGNGNLLVSFIAMGVLAIATVVFFAPIGIALLIWSSTSGEIIVVVIAVIWSVVVLVGGMEVGSRVFNRGQAHLLAVIRSWPGH